MGRKNLKARIIPVLLLRGGRMVKGREFGSFRDVGDPVSVVRIYNAQNVDELVLLDIDATMEGRDPALNIIERVSEECFLPFAVGGGVRSERCIGKLLEHGADKVVINSAAVEVPDLVRKGAYAYGNQCIVVSVDVRLEPDGYVVYTRNGTVRTGLRLEEHLRRMEGEGAGEILLNSIDRDGMMNGYDLALIQAAHSVVSLPVVISGGSGNLDHLYHAVNETGVSGVGCGSVFYFADNNPIRARSHLRQKGLPMRNL